MQIACPDLNSTVVTTEGQKLCDILLLALHLNSTVVTTEELEKLWKRTASGI